MPNINLLDISADIINEIEWKYLSVRDNLNLTILNKFFYSGATSANLQAGKLRIIALRKYNLETALTARGFKTAEIENILATVPAEYVGNKDFKQIIQLIATPIISTNIYHRKAKKFILARLDNINNYFSVIKQQSLSLLDKVIVQDWLLYVVLLHFFYKQKNLKSDTKIIAGIEIVKSFSNKMGELLSNILLLNPKENVAAKATVFNPAAPASLQTLHQFEEFTLESFCAEMLIVAACDLDHIKHYAKFHDFINILLNCVQLDCSQLKEMRPDPRFSSGGAHHCVYLYNSLAENKQKVINLKEFYDFIVNNREIAINLLQVSNTIFQFFDQYLKQRHEITLAAISKTKIRMHEKYNIESIIEDLLRKIPKNKQSKLTEKNLKNGNNILTEIKQFYQDFLSNKINFNQYEENKLLYDISDFFVEAQESSIVDFLYAWHNFMANSHEKINSYFYFGVMRHFGGRIFVKLHCTKIQGINIDYLNGFFIPVFKQLSENMNNSYSARITSNESLIYLFMLHDAFTLDGYINFPLLKNYYENVVHTFEAKDAYFPTFGSGAGMDLSRLTYQEMIDFKLFAQQPKYGTYFFELLHCNTVSDELLDIVMREVELFISPDEQKVVSENNFFSELSINLIDWLFKLSRMNYEQCDKNTNKGNLIDKLLRSLYLYYESEKPKFDEVIESFNNLIQDLSNRFGEESYSLFLMMLWQYTKERGNKNVYPDFNISQILELICVKLDNNVSLLSALAFHFKEQNKWFLISETPTKTEKRNLTNWYNNFKQFSSGPMTRGRKRAQIIAEDVQKTSEQNKPDDDSENNNNCVKKAKPS